MRKYDSRKRDLSHYFDGFACFRHTPDFRKVVFGLPFVCICALLVPQQMDGYFIFGIQEPLHRSSVTLEYEYSGSKNGLLTRGTSENTIAIFSKTVLTILIKFQ
jgi:hypothetical protein